MYATISTNAWPWYAALHLRPLIASAKTGCRGWCCSHAAYDNKSGFVSTYTYVGICILVLYPSRATLRLVEMNLSFRTSWARPYNAKTWGKISVKTASRVFLLFPWHGHSSASNDLEMFVMIDILDWKIDWICLEERGRTKINSNTIIFMGCNRACMQNQFSESFYFTPPKPCKSWNKSYMR